MSSAEETTLATAGTDSDEDPVETADPKPLSEHLSPDPEPQVDDTWFRETMMLHRDRIRRSS